MAGKTRWDFIGSLCETPGSATSQPAALLEACGLARFGSWDEAIAQLDALIGTNPDLRSAWVVKGECLRATDRPQQALECYSRALQLEQEGEFSEARILLSVALALCSMGEFGQAADCLNRSTRLDPTNAEAWKIFGIALRHMGAFDQALAALNQAVRLRPGDAGALVEIGFIYHQLGRVREALEYFDRTVRSLDGLPEVEQRIVAVEALQAKADALEDLDRRDEALACIDSAVQSYPDSPTLWACRGRLLLGLERFAEALTSLDRSTRLDALNATAWQNKALSLKRLERYEDALESYDRAIALKPDLALSWLQKGEMLILHLNRVREGVPCVRRALQLNPQLGRRLAPAIMMLIRNPNL